MKAAQVTAPGTVELIEVERPTPGPGEVLVRVTASTLNPVDAVVASGALGTGVGLGWDVIGPVEALGDGATTYAVGDLVAGVRTDITGALRGLAEYAVVPESDLAALPEGLDVSDAASIGMNALTAQQALALLGEPADRSLLVTGAAGSVGGLAIEIARDLGWHVTGLARDSDRGYVEGAGAELATDLLSTFDAVFDPAMLHEALVGHVADGGHVVGVQPSAPRPVIPGAEVEAVGVRPDGAALADLLQRTVDGRLSARVAGTFPLGDLDEALVALGRPGTRGRWVVVP